MRQRQRKKYGVCTCGAAAFPHRTGWCAKGTADAVMARLAWGDPDEVRYVRAVRERLARRRKAG